MKKTSSGKLVISLDFELYWGVMDKRSVDEYRKNLSGTRQACIDILSLFEEYDISATWAVVGLLFANNTQSAIKGLPKNKKNKPILEYLTALKSDLDFHFAQDIIQKIKSVKYQEIGTHTYSHYYALDDEASEKTFLEDVKAAIEISKKNIPGHVCSSLVFPRNQVNEDYLDGLSNLGIKCFRGVQRSFLYTSKNKENKFVRLLRLMDAYINLSGANTFAMHSAISNLPINIPASSMLRPYSVRFKYLENLKMNRIKKSMLVAAKKGEVYHLWWHPHNFGMNTSENINNLKNLLNYYLFLRAKYGMRSESMSGLLNDNEK